MRYGSFLYVRNKGAKGSSRNGTRTFFEEVQKLENITRDMNQSHNMTPEEIMTLSSSPGSTVREMLVNTMAKFQVHGSSRASVAKRENECFARRKISQGLYPRLLRQVRESSIMKTKRIPIEQYILRQNASLREQNQQNHRLSQLF